MVNRQFPNIASMEFSVTWAACISISFPQVRCYYRVSPTV
jgi:hypothetical protein